MSMLSRDEMIARVLKVSRWDKLSRQEFHELLAADCEYLNVPQPELKTVGPDQAYELLSAFGDAWIMTDLDVKNIVSEGDVVLIERHERFEKASGGATVHLPSMGAFEFRGGKIVQWRDYFDREAVKPFAA